MYSNLDTRTPFFYKEVHRNLLIIFLFINMCERGKITWDVIQNKFVMSDIEILIELLSEIKYKILSNDAIYKLINFKNKSIKGIFKKLPDFSKYNIIINYLKLCNIYNVNIEKSIINRFWDTFIGYSESENLDFKFVANSIKYLSKYRKKEKIKFKFEEWEKKLNNIILNLGNHCDDPYFEDDKELILKVFNTDFEFTTETLTDKNNLSKSELIESFRNNYAWHPMYINEKDFINLINNYESLYNKSNDMNELILSTMKYDKIRIFPYERLVYVYVLYKKIDKAIELTDLLINNLIEETNHIFKPI